MGNVGSTGRGGQHGEGWAAGVAVLLCLYLVICEIYSLDWDWRQIYPHLWIQWMLASHMLSTVYALRAGIFTWKWIYLFEKLLSSRAAVTDGCECGFKGPHSCYFILDMRPSSWANVAERQGWDAFHLETGFSFSSLSRAPGLSPSNFHLFS